MASKQYISLIRLFEHCGTPAWENFNLSRTKKQLLAEFSIAREGFIEVDGYTYTRQDVFEEIDRPDFSKRLGFHEQIWKRSQILQLLEKNTADLNTIKEEFKIFWKNKEFDEFFSPYFAGPFNYLSRTFLAGAKLSELGNLYAYEDFLQPAEREEAFRPVRVFLDESLMLLRNVNKENYRIMRPKIIHWIDTDWHIFFNNLPHEFYDIKAEITSRLINIGVAVQKSRRRDCRKMSKQLVSLHDIPESLQNVIVSNHAVYMGSSRSIIPASTRNLFWIGWVLFMLIRGAAGGCGGETKTQYKDLYQFDQKRYVVPDSVFKIMTNKDSGVRIVLDTVSTKRIH